jgi:amino acid transporter
MTSFRATATNDDYFWHPDYPMTSNILNDISFALYFISIFMYLLFVLPRACTRRMENRPKTLSEILGILTSAVVFIIASILSIASICINDEVGTAWIAVPVIIIVLCMLPLTSSSIEFHEYNEEVKEGVEEEVFILRREDVVVVGPAFKG